MRRAELVAADLFVELVTGTPHHPAHETPAERFALDAALLKGQGHALPSFADSFLTGFENRLEHRIEMMPPEPHGG